MTYATVEDFREFTTTDATDIQIEAALSFAKALVDGRAGRSFSYVTEQVIHDVRTDIVALPIDGNITGVFIGDTEIPESSYVKTDWGLRFSAPQGGVWYHPSHPLTYEPIRMWWGSGRGVSIRVVGAFGGVPELIKRATLLLVKDDLDGGAGGSSSNPVPAMPSDIQSFSVEGLSVSRFAKAAGEPDKESTGNSTADRFIDMAVGSTKHGVV